jgi:hypothetical protein
LCGFLENNALWFDPDKIRINLQIIKRKDCRLILSSNNDGLKMLQTLS